MNHLAFLCSRPKCTDWSGQPVAWCEQKLDGVRLTIVKDTDGVVTAVGRKETLDNFPKLQYLTELVRVANALPNGTIVDGELHPEHGISSDVSALVKAKKPLLFTAFALPFLEGNDFRNTGLQPMHDKLKDLGFMHPDRQPFNYNIREMQVRAADRKIEGWVVKAQHYRGWYRIKPVQTIDAVVIEALPGKNRLASAIGALRLGVFADGELRCVAKCGSGLNDAERFGVDRESLVGRVCEVTFDSVTRDLSLRFPVFMRWRDDKPAHECSIQQLKSLLQRRSNV